MKIGVTVWCNVCGRGKAPHGRSVSLEAANSYCDDECPGYRQDPLPGCLFPGETDEDFGNECCDHATRELSDDEAAIRRGQE